MYSRQAIQNARFAARCASRPAAHVKPQFRAQKPRFQSTDSASTGAATGQPALVGAISGAAAAVTVGYIFYRQSGARDVVQASKKTKEYVNATTQKIKENTPEPNEALDWLRNAAQSYAAFIPGAKGYVDAAFNDIDAIRAKHGDEVDAIVSDAYGELRDVLKGGDISVFTAQKAWQVLVKHLGRISDLSGDVAEQIMDNHPKLREKVGGNLDTLKQLGDQYGPEVKKEVDRTWGQISDIIKTGVSAANIEKIKSLVQEKVEKVKELGDKAFEKGLEQAKPYLDKNPQVKKLIDENKDALKTGNVQELYEKVKTAVEKGDTGDLEKYVKDAASAAKDKAKQYGVDTDSIQKYAEQYMNKIPGGGEILPKLQQLQKAASEHGDEAQKIFKDAMAEVTEVLKKHGEKAEKLAESAKEDAKK